MEKEKHCPECGSNDLSLGSFGVNCKLYPINKMFLIGKGSEVIAEVCTECGHILNLKVSNPKKFK